MTENAEMANGMHNLLMWQIYIYIYIYIYIKHFLNAMLAFKLIKKASPKKFKKKNVN